MSGIRFPQSMQRKAQPRACLHRSPGGGVAVLFSEDVPAPLSGGVAVLFPEDVPAPLSEDVPAPFFEDVSVPFSEVVSAPFFEDVSAPFSEDTVVSNPASIVQHSRTLSSIESLLLVLIKMPPNCLIGGYRKPPQSAKN